MKAIETEEDYRAALARIETLMDAEPNSPAEEEFERISSLVEQYEEEHFPIGDPDPAAAVKFRMEQEGLPVDWDAEG